jgi:hypothetical protein
VREPDPSVVAIQRRLADEAGLCIDRLIVELGAHSNLPYADNMVDVVIATRADAGTLARLSASEVLRVLTPGGKAIIGTTGGTTDQQVSRWLLAGRVESGKIRETDGGMWLRFSFWRALMNGRIGSTARTIIPCPPTRSSKHRT